MDLRETYDRIAADWVKDHEADTWWVEAAERFASRLIPGAKVLDVGCAGGVKSQFFHDRGLDVSGIDVSSKMVALAQARVPDATFLVADLLETLPFHDGSFDAVFAQAVLLHIPKLDVPSVIRELKRVLKPGGWMQIAVKERRPGQPEEQVVTESDFGYPYERFFSYFTQSELELNLRSAGLELVDVDVTPAGATRWLQLVVRKP